MWIKFGSTNALTKFLRTVCFVTLLQGVLTIPACLITKEIAGKNNPAIAKTSDNKPAEPSAKDEVKQSPPETISSAKKESADKKNTTPESVHATEKLEARKIEIKPGKEMTSSSKKPGAKAANTKLINDEEEQEVRSAALKLAQTCESLIHIKICYIIADDEWWVSLYDDMGPQVDLRSFIWDRDNQRLRPFLVLTRIPKNKLEQHVYASGEDRSCFLLEPLKPLKEEKQIKSPDPAKKQ